MLKKTRSALFSSTPPERGLFDIGSPAPSSSPSPSSSSSSSFSSEQQQREHELANLCDSCYFFASLMPTVHHEQSDADVDVGSFVHVTVPRSTLYPPVVEKEPKAPQTKAQTTGPLLRNAESMMELPVPGRTRRTGSRGKRMTKWRPQNVVSNVHRE